MEYSEYNVDWKQVAENRKQVNVSRSRQIDELRDRLAKLEDGIRALADKYHNADAEQPGAVVRADTFELELRALLDEDRQ